MERGSYSNGTNRRPVELNYRRGSAPVKPVANQWSDIKPQSTAPIATPSPTNITVKPEPKLTTSHRPSQNLRLHPKPPTQDLIRQSTQPIQQMLQPAQTQEAVPPSRKKANKLSIALVCLALIAFASGAVVSWNAIKTNDKVKAQANNLNKDSDVPDETKPSDGVINYHTVAPDLPRLFTIEKLGVRARINRLGIKADGSLAAPGNIYDVGWYENSSKPDEYGAMLLDGHVHGPTMPGIFAELNKLNKGDIVNVERGDRKVFNYKVVDTKTFDKDKVDMASALTPVVAGAKGLNLITCAGELNTSTNDYEKRLVIYAVQVL